MVQRAPMIVVVSLISMRRRLALLARMRVLGRVIDIVIRSYSIVARQRASPAWVPPERAALAGRRNLDRKNLEGGCPVEQGEERLCVARRIGRKDEALLAARQWYLPN